MQASKHLSHACRWHAMAEGGARPRDAGYAGMQSVLAAHLTAAVYCAVHGCDGREVYHLHIPLEMRVPHNLTCSAGVHTDDSSVAKVEHVTAVQLHKVHRCVQRGSACPSRERQRGHALQYVAMHCHSAMSGLGTCIVMQCNFPSWNVTKWMGPETLSCINSEKLTS